MKRFPCLILDANIVICLFAQGLWNAVVQHCELIVSETVIDEADYFQDSAGVERGIDLQSDIESGRIKVISVSATEIASFRAKFDPLYVQKLDDGETESLCFCLEEGTPYQLCSSDAIVFKVLALMDRSEQGVSLGEVLHAIGLSRVLPRQFTKPFREENRSRGLSDRLAGIGLKPCGPVSTLKG
jgi:hypothetical protein